jgi:hypothetical protein
VSVFRRKRRDDDGSPEEAEDLDHTGDDVDEAEDDGDGPDAGANVIQGLSLSSFASNIGSVELDGLISRRVQTTALVSYADGRAGSQQRGNYSSLSGSVLLRYALERCCDLSMQYEYYDYRFRNLDLPPGVPMSYDRQALKLGFTLWVPLYTRFIRN